MIYILMPPKESVLKSTATPIGPRVKKTLKEDYPHVFQSRYIANPSNMGEFDRLLWFDIIPKIWEREHPEVTSSGKPWESSSYANAKYVDRLPSDIYEKATDEAKRRVKEIEIKRKEEADREQRQRDMEEAERVFKKQAEADERMRQQAELRQKEHEQRLKEIESVPEVAQLLEGEIPYETGAPSMFQPSMIPSEVFTELQETIRDTHKADQKKLQEVIDTVKEANNIDRPLSLTELYQLGTQFPMLAGEIRNQLIKQIYNKKIELTGPNSYKQQYQQGLIPKIQYDMINNLTRDITQDKPIINIKRFVDRKQLY
jgi:hypothetical protein